MAPVPWLASVPSGGSGSGGGSGSTWGTWGVWNNILSHVTCVIFLIFRLHV